ncbi:MAG: aminotransferase class V-fold PLP-dependent enzyme [Alphaproteobacteria bacterium]|nr:MAG: aminotransferase class V-fold PLP-dependent enzyme [Alphaproteobacteria bacterium]
MHRTTDPRPALGLRPVINVAGTMTYLGASSVRAEAIAAMAAILPEFVEMGALQRYASRALAAATGAEAGFVTASAAAGVSLTLAGAMTGADPARIERLPDTEGMTRRVLIQAGHHVHYGAPVTQAIRLTGAEPVLLGTATRVEPYHLLSALEAPTAAVLFVVSHHTVDHGQLSLEEVVAQCRPRAVPVIVDAASEYDLTGFLARGADAVVYSGHKFLGGPTAGIVVGRTALVRAAYLQTLGIGRGMKVGKESIVGVLAALAAFQARDAQAVRAREDAAIALWAERLADLPGLTTAVVPDPTGNPLVRLEVLINPSQAGTTAWDLADWLAAGDPPVIVRDHMVEHGRFQLDPCNLHPGEAEIVADCIRQCLAQGGPRRTLADRRAAKLAALLAWPE